MQQEQHFFDQTKNTVIVQLFFVGGLEEVVHHGLGILVFVQTEKGSGEKSTGQSQFVGIKVSGGGGGGGGRSVLFGFEVFHGSFNLCFTRGFQVFEILFFVKIGKIHQIDGKCAPILFQGGSLGGCEGSHCRLCVDDSCWLLLCV